MPMDWTVPENYGRPLIFPPTSLAAVPLYRIPDAATDDVSEVQDENDHLFLNRIVGQVYPSFLNPTVAFARIGWRLMPLQADIDANALQLPVDPAVTTLDDQDFANLRWWDERRMEIPVPIPGANETIDPVVTHPWWSHMDCKPKQSFGFKDNLWPALVVWNGSADELTIVQRLRLLCSYR